MKIDEYDWLVARRASCEHPDGWNQVVNDLLKEIDAVLCGTDMKLYLLQTKEKFGELRFYFQMEAGSLEIREKIDELVAKATSRSARTCIVCGDPGETDTDGWITVRCDKHRREKKE